MKPRPAIAAAVVVQGGRVLLVRRRAREGTLVWQFPAGETEPGESPLEAAVRETAEETGLRVTVAGPAGLLGERVHPVTGRRIVYVACEVQSGTAHLADAEELAELAWCGRAEVSAYVPYGLHPPVQAYLDEVTGG